MAQPTWNVYGYASSRSSTRPPPEEESDMSLSLHDSNSSGVTARSFCEMGEEEDEEALLLDLVALGMML